MTSHKAPTPAPATKAYKAAAAAAPALAAALAVLLAEGGDILPPWVLLLLAAVSAFLTYWTPNPPR